MLGGIDTEAPLKRLSTDMKDMPSQNRAGNVAQYPSINLHCHPDADRGTSHPPFREGLTGLIPTVKKPRI